MRLRRMRFRQRLRRRNVRSDGKAGKTAPANTVPKAKDDTTSSAARKTVATGRSATTATTGANAAGDATVTTANGVNENIGLTHRPAPNGSGRPRKALRSSHAKTAASESVSSSLSRRWRR